jgi:hypothetical protein
MAEAVGIHAHPVKKLGKRPPVRKDTVSIADFMTGQIPEHPVVNMAPMLTYPMDHNDVAGDCVVAGADHALQVISASLGVPRRNWTDAQILTYYQTQNPNFRSWADGGTDADGGMIIQDFLSTLVRVGEIVAFGAVDFRNQELMEAATYVGLAIVTGEDLRVAQQSQKVWDYSAKSPDWGGHCTTTVGYLGNENQTCVTWGALQDMTEGFISHQVDEAWLVLTQAHLSNPQFRNAFDLAGFAAAIAELTGNKVIVPVPPVPDPVPPPPTPTPIPPTPVDPLADFPRQQVRSWVDQKSPGHTKAERIAKAAMAQWMADHDL